MGQGGGGKIQEIVVTAQHRVENAQHAPIAVTVVSGADIAAAGVTTPEALTKLVPALTIVDAGPKPLIFIRGVGTTALNAYGDPAVAFNVDQVYVARPEGTSGYFYDLNRIEVVKGPQGTLYGRNATGGAINIITQKPTQEYGGYADLQFGNYGDIESRAAVNVPITDTLAVRAAIQTVDHDGYFKDGYDDQHDQSGRLHVLWKPTPDVSLLLTGDYSHQGGKGDTTVPLGVGPNDNYYLTGNPWAGINTPAVKAFANPQLNLPIGGDGHENNRNWGVSADLEWITGLGDVSVIAAHRDTHPHFTAYLSGFQQQVDDKADQNSIEVRLASHGDSRLKWLVGGFYYREQHTALQQYDQGVVTGIINTNSTPLTDESYAFFTQETFSITPKLRLTGGLRYTNERKTQAGDVLAPEPIFLAAIVPGPIYCLPNAFAAGKCVIPSTGGVSFSDVNYKVGLDYDLGARSLLYASVATGFKAGGFFPGGAPNTYAPEKITAYTVGSKNRFFDNRLQLNVEGFYWDYRDLQIEHLGPINPIGSGYAEITTNASKATIAGVEAEAIWRATSNDTFTANVQYLYSEYNDFKYVLPGAPVAFAPPSTRCAVTPGAISPMYHAPSSYNVDCSGRRATETPDLTATFSYKHVFDLADGAHLSFMANTHVESRSWLGPEYLPGERQNAWSMTDLSLGYNDPSGKWTVTTFVRNVGDEVVKSYPQLSSVEGNVWTSLRPPRTYGVQIGRSF